MRSAVRFVVTDFGKASFVSGGMKLIFFGRDETHGSAGGFSS